MGKKSRAKKVRKEAQERRRRYEVEHAEAVAAYRRYATDPIYRQLVDVARATQYERREKPFAKAIMRAEAHRRLMAIMDAQREQEEQWYRSIYRALPAPREQ